jgi:hypothetical protein
MRTQYEGLQAQMHEGEVLPPSFKGQTRYIPKDARPGLHTVSDAQAALQPVLKKGGREPAETVTFENRLLGVVRISDGDP